MAETEQTSSGSSILRPRARLLRTFGDELISNETVAVVELVKNAYDADATRVWIRFHEPLELHKGMIEVIDNGHGMTLETIQSAWMEPATLSRKRNRFSEGFGRRVLGEKGIGRFAASRLADTLEVITRRAGMSQEINVSFNWADFEDEDKYLDEISVKWRQSEPQEVRPGGTIDKLWKEIGKPHGDDLTHGTILRMQGLKAIWRTKQFDDLRRALSRLISPRVAEKDKHIQDFQILLKLPEIFQDYQGEIEPPEIIKRPHYIIAGNVGSDGTYKLQIQHKEKEKSETKQGKFMLENKKEPACGSFGIELRVWNRDRASLIGPQSEWTLEQIRRYLNDHAGISVYRDGFRVLPYGEPHNDWLRLDLRRVQNPTDNLSNNQIIGSVFITYQDNPLLRDQSNREGILEGDAYDNFKELIVCVLKMLEISRRKERPRQKKVAERGIFMEFNLASIRDYVGKKHPDDVDLLKAVVDKEKDLESRVAEVEEVISRYRRLATLGMLIDTVLHDGRTPLSKIVTTSYLGQRDALQQSSSNGEFRETIRGYFGIISNQSEVLATLFRKIEPFGGRRRGRPAKISIESVITHAFAVLDAEIHQVGAEVDLPDTYTEVTVDEAEIQEVIVNLLMNSLHWLKQVPKGERFIAVQVHPAGDGELEIIFSDSGPGVDEDVKGMIFEPYFSTKPNGVGLGLTIAGEIVSDYYDGQLELMKEGPQPGATFKILLRRRV